MYYTLPRNEESFFLLYHNCKYILCIKNREVGDGSWRKISQHMIKGHLVKLKN